VIGGSGQSKWLTLATSQIIRRHRSCESCARKKNAEHAGQLAWGGRDMLRTGISLEGFPD
jgi:hypothetical protein